MTPRERIEALERFDFEGMHREFPNDFVPLSPSEALWLLRIAKAAVEWREVCAPGHDDRLVFSKLDAIVAAVDDVEERVVPEIITALARVAEEAAAQERERCTDIVVQFGLPPGATPAQARLAASVCAAIRALGQEPEGTK